MRHLKDKTHLNRSKSHRKALLANLSAALFINKRIITTLAKARYARRFAERMITFARRDDIAARRQVLRYVPNKEAVKLLFSDLGPHFKHRNGGYTRIIKLGPRRGDAAPMAILELVGFDDAAASAPPRKEGKSRLKAAQAPVASEEKEDITAAQDPGEVVETETTVSEDTQVKTEEEAAPEENDEC